jgi:hypothetical protein
MSSKGSKRDSLKVKDKDKEGKNAKKDKDEEKMLGTRGAREDGMGNRMKEAMMAVKARPIEYEDERDYTKFFEKQVYPLLHRMKHDLVDENPREMVTSAESDPVLRRLDREGEERRQQRPGV